MKLSKLFSFLKPKLTLIEEQHQAGTGFMMDLAEGIREYQAKGYVENLVPGYDHLSCRSGEFKLYPKDFFIDEMLRFENSSDPDDQSILYAIYSPAQKLKGLYVESYGVYHDELSAAMLERIKYCRQQRQHQQKSLIHIVERYADAGY